jgi:tetratricopeptide (TPR) repeat protein
MNVSHQSGSARYVFLAVGVFAGALATAVYFTQRKPVDHYAAGIELMQKSRFSDAAGAFERALRANPENPAAMISLATALQSDRNEDAALKAYREADTATSKMLTQFYGNLAALYTKRQETANAESAYRKLAAFQTQSTDSFYNLGMSAAAKGQYAEAIRNFEDVLRADPRHAGAAFQAARASEQMGDKRRALTWYQNALRIDPTLKAARDRVAALTGGKAEPAKRSIASAKPVVEKAPAKATRAPASATPKKKQRAH